MGSRVSLLPPRGCRARNENKARRGEIPQTNFYPYNKEGEIILRRRATFAKGAMCRFTTLSEYCFMSQKPECRLPTEVSTLCAAARNVSSLGNVVSDSIDWGEHSSQPILKMDEPVCLKFSRRNFKIL